MFQIFLQKSIASGFRSSSSFLESVILKLCQGVFLKVWFPIRGGVMLRVEILVPETKFVELHLSSLVDLRKTSLFKFFCFSDKSLYVNDVLICQNSSGLVRGIDCFVEMVKIRVKVFVVSPSCLLGWLGTVDEGILFGCQFMFTHGGREKITINQIELNSNCQIVKIMGLFIFLFFRFSPSIVLNLKARFFPATTWKHVHSLLSIPTFYRGDSTHSFSATHNSYLALLDWFLAATAWKRIRIFVLLLVIPIPSW